VIVRPWAIAAALACAGGLIALTASMRRTQAEQAAAYASVAAHQRKAAGATRAVEADRPIPPAPGCVTGAEGFAGAAAHGIAAFPAGARLATLVAVSDAAVRSEQEAELLRPAPALPQRMGLAGGVAVDPPRGACAGTGWAEAHVVSVPAPPPARAKPKRRR
jgi:hypothetical protein